MKNDVKRVKPIFSSALILHDEGDKDYKKEKVEAYKEGKIDFYYCLFYATDRL